MKTLIPTPIANHNAALDAVEALIGQFTIRGMISLMAEVASAKADHVRSNWQDEAMGKLWDRTAALLLNMQERIKDI